MEHGDPIRLKPMTKDEKCVSLAKMGQRRCWIKMEIH